jgi:hypothetical protein
MRPGDIAVLMDEHVGVDDEMRSHILTPGDFGLVISIDDETTTLLISNHIIYVQTFSLAKIPIQPENIQDFH